MPNLKDAKKRLRQNEKQRLRNSARKSRVRSARKSFLTALEGGDEATIKAAYSTYCSSLDKAVKTNVIRKGNAIRNKHRAAERLRKAS